MVSSASSALCIMLGMLRHLLFQSATEADWRWNVIHITSALKCRAQTSSSPFQHHEWNTLCSCVCVCVFEQAYVCISALRKKCMRFCKCVCVCVF
jgi:hypothetical protein